MSNRKRKRPKVDKPGHNFAQKDSNHLGVDAKPEKKKESKYEVTIDLTGEEFHGLMGDLQMLLNTLAKAYGRIDNRKERDELAKVHQQTDDRRKMLQERARPIN